jgi:NADH:ubiquinone oxidoreductase subunit 6 (subunit J)
MNPFSVIGIICYGAVFIFTVFSLLTKNMEEREKRTTGLLALASATIVAMNIIALVGQS